jgi:superfamily II DNA or RNA helicase
MLKDCDWSIDRDYKTGSENEPMQFYLEGLANSLEFSLLLGYFSSAAINLLSLGFATFISRGGKMRLVINHILSSKDRDLISRVEENPGGIKLFNITDIVNLKKVLNEYDTHFFECLAFLIAQKRIEIKVIKPKNGKGIVHYKAGVFSDGIDAIGYQASCNFTYYGLSENIEQLEAFLSWENGRSNKLIKKQLKLIEDYFSEKDENVDYISSNQIEVVLKEKFGAKDINELLVQEDQLLKKKQSLVENISLNKTINKIVRDIEVISRSPRFPYAEGPREYQIDAYESWVANNYKGIFAMATGTGKTITSLNCLLTEYHKTGVYRAVIVVLTISLIEQWKKECSKFNFRNVVTVSSKTNWNSDISFYNTASRFIDTSFVVIVTYASFGKEKFQNHLSLFPDNTILIADEVHNLGAESFQKILLAINLEKRIGLSATPNRKYDEDGNLAIQNFFADKYPFVFSFSMEKALELGWLCSYLYYPHIVKLNEIEQLEYIKISRQLTKHIDPQTKKYRKSQIVETLLLKRKRIIHKANNKLSAFASIVSNEFERKGTLNYTLVYVPEGKEANYELDDIGIEDLEDINLIDEYTRAVRDIDFSILVKQFTAQSSNREDILRDFEIGKIHVLTSMKCLDEGIDIPRSELAIFCSSSGNPRQFIQRRGRVLRQHKDKLHAVIHDIVVVPEININEGSYEMERNLIKTELSRVVDFSSLAINKTESFDKLKNILEYYNLNLYDL